MEETKGVSPVWEKVVDPKKEARKAEKKARREKQRALLEKLGAAMAKTQDQEIKKIWNEFATAQSQRPVSNGQASYAKFVQLVETKKNVSEEEIFKTFHVGRKDCAGYLRKYLKNALPEERIWINFTPSDGTYRFLSKGKEMPKNYTGYVPSDEILDISK